MKRAGAYFAPALVFSEILYHRIGILKGLRPFSGVQRLSLWQGDSPQCGEMSAKLTEGTDRLGRDRVPHLSAGRFARGEFQNSPGDCFGRGVALQVKGSPDIPLFCGGAVLFQIPELLHQLKILCVYLHVGAERFAF